jgi:putative acetyltransferase
MEILIRKYVNGEEPILRELFFQTIHDVNVKHYTEQQVNAWAPKHYDKAEWFNHVESTQPYVAVVEDDIAGYADVQQDGYIDHFFCHSRYQGQGIGAALMNELLNKGRELDVKRFYSQVSITAKPFFEKFGFRVLRSQSVCIRGVNLTNYMMERGHG